MKDRYMSKYVGNLKSSRIILPVIYAGFSAYQLRWDYFDGYFAL